MDDKLIPFGKYKGKPIEILANDRQYTDWLLAQSFFKEKHLNLYNVVINNFREPVDTPEHNKIQIKFLKAEYRLKLAYYINKDIFKYSSQYINEKILELVNELDEYKLSLFLEAFEPSSENYRRLHSRKILKAPNPNFETIDVYFKIHNGINFNYNCGYREFTSFDYLSENYFWIEIKPTVSDDYPAVLRQMKASMPYQRSSYNFNNFFILLIGEYTGIGASKQEFIDFFRTQGYIVVFTDEIDKVELPKFDKELKFNPKLIKLIDERKSK